MKSKQFETNMRGLATKLGNEFNYDGGGDDRIFLDDLNILVFASDMTKGEYEVMEKDIADFEIKDKNYTVYIWNDCNGYEYWFECGENHDPKYIQVTACIKNPTKVDIDRLRADMIRTYEHFYKWHNIDSHDFEKRGN